MTHREPMRPVPLTVSGGSDAPQSQPSDTCPPDRSGPDTRRDERLPSHKLRLESVRGNIHSRYPDPGVHLRGREGRTRSLSPGLGIRTGTRSLLRRLRGTLRDGHPGSGGLRKTSTTSTNPGKGVGVGWGRSCRKKDGTSQTSGSRNKEKVVG